MPWVGVTTPARYGGGGGNVANDCGVGVTSIWGLAATTGTCEVVSEIFVPKNETIIVVSTPPKSPSTTATPISLYLPDSILSLCEGEAIQASIAELGSEKSLA